MIAEMHGTAVMAAATGGMPPTGHMQGAGMLAGLWVILETTRRESGTVLTASLLGLGDKDLPVPQRRRRQQPSLQQQVTCVERAR
jgi:hypothetical protein